jgi:hypothetical protein
VQGYNSFGAPIGTLKTYTTDTSGSILINKNDIDKNAAKINYYKEDMRACSGGICTGDKTELFVANKTVNSTYNLNNVDITNYPVILVPGIMGSTIDNPLSIVPRLGKYTNATSKTYDQSKLFLADASGEWKVNIIGNVANFLVDFTKGEELGWDLMIKKLEKMDKYLHGLVNLEKLPDALYIADLRVEKTALTEARKVGIPVVAVCDTNVDPTKATYVIPANDDAVNSIQMMADLAADAINEGRKEFEKKEKVVEVKEMKKSTPTTTAPTKERRALTKEASI